LSAVDCALTVNAGSSSIKYALFARGGDPSEPVLAGQIEGLGVNGQSHAQGMSQVLERVSAGAAQGRHVTVVGHRIVHGGTAFVRPVLIDGSVVHALQALSPLAPLHQPHNLAGVAAARAAFPGVPQVACFDTAFHRTQPAVHQRFALPAAWHDAGVQRYGFHGLSYESICAQLAADEPALAGGRVIVAHLGNGASMCAISGGRSVATTMSFSPLDGLTMGTRCGRLDAAVVLHLIDHHGMDTAAVSDLLHKQSGLLGLSGLSADVRTLLASEQPSARLALDHFVESAARELAGLAASMHGVDTLVFTGGIGENSGVLRSRIVETAAWMGLRLDAAANAAGECRINAADSAVQLRVMRTNEEAVIARHAFQVGALPATR
jgi:acetate kinase